ncbi:hypothetical protein ABT369_03410 [Dactylosporangium sp. NPDC000244]|uniref:fibronectin type III domain-containing protein n=1 Tax=Dactylosporangium sp. NPDC000244 TaxID=3154365 RepID=UPI003318CE30
MACLTAYRFPEAYQLLVEARSLIGHGVEATSTDVFDAGRLLAETMLALGDPDQAETLVVELADADLGPYQQTILACTRGRVLAAQGHLDAAYACYHQAARQDHPRARWPMLLATAGQALTVAALGRPHDAEPALTRAYHRLLSEYGTAPVEVVQIGTDLARLRRSLGYHDTARNLLAHLQPAAPRTLGAAHPLVEQLAALGQTPDIALPDHGRAITPPEPPRWYWLRIAAIVCLLAGTVTAVVLLGVALQHQVAPPTPSPTTTTEAARESWQPQRAAAWNVRIARDTGTTISIAWDDPSGGTAATVIFLIKDDDPPVVAATLPAATISYRLTGLDPHARRYCIRVAVAYHPTAVVAAPDVCSTRPTASTTPSGRPR